MEETPQVVEPLSVQPDEPDGEAANVGFGRYRAVGMGGPVVVMVFNARVQEPEALDVFGIAGLEVTFLRIALAASPVEVAILVLEV